MEKIKVAQWGCGKMATLIMKSLYEKGGEIVAAFDINEQKVGKDISALIGGEQKNVFITDAKLASEVLQKTKPDICIIATMSLLKDVYDALKTCAELGINAISTCEELFYPFNSNPKLTEELDEIAKRTGCTLTGSGYQDVYWGNLIATIAGSMNHLKKITGRSCYNVEDYGIALAEAHGAGLTPEQFDKRIASVSRMSEEEIQKAINDGDFLPSYRWNTNGWIAEKLGLTVIHQFQETIPTVSSEDLYSSTLQLVVKAGDATGMSAVVTTETKEGITLEFECIGKVYSEGEADCNEWMFFEEDGSVTTVTLKKPNTPKRTCATVVNRIPDVIKARAGLVSTVEMPTPKYRKEI